MADNNLDYNIGRKSKETKEEIIFKFGIPIPRYIEFNIWGACNRSCPFCPVSNPQIYENRHEGILLRDFFLSLYFVGISALSFFSNLVGS